MENNQSALQARHDALKKAINGKQKELDCFDVSDYYDEYRFIEEMREEYGSVNIMGYEYNAIDAIYKLDNVAFREMYNNYTDSLDRDNFKEYKELKEELKELENELLDIEDQIEKE